MTLTMTKPGNVDDVIMKGICCDCGAEYETDSRTVTRLDHNCEFCQGIRTVLLYPEIKKELMYG